MSETAATLIPNSFKVFAFFLRLHSSSWVYSPRDAPTENSWTPLEVDIKQESFPDDIKLGAIEEDTGIPLEPCPLYVLLTLLLFEF